MHLFLFFLPLPPHTWCRVQCGNEIRGWGEIYTFEASTWRWLPLKVPTRPKLQSNNLARHEWWEQTASLSATAHANRNHKETEAPSAAVKKKTPTPFHLFGLPLGWKQQGTSSQRGDGHVNVRGEKCEKTCDYLRPFYTRLGVFGETFDVPLWFICFAFKLHCTRAALYGFHMVPAHVLCASFLRGLADALVALLIQEIFTSPRTAPSKFVDW